LVAIPDGAGFFKLFWVGIALVGAGTSFYNAFSRRGIATEVIDVDDDAAHSDGYQGIDRRRRVRSAVAADPGLPAQSAEARLSTLKGLLEKQLITPQEYEERRQEIVRTL
jgi:hypothetical protein